MENFNLEIKFKISVLCAGIGFVTGLFFTDFSTLDKDLDLGASVGLALILGIFGFSVLPAIIYEFSNPSRKLYFLCGPIGVAFIKLVIRVFIADGKITGKEKDIFDAYMDKEFGKSIDDPLYDFIDEYKIASEKITDICKPLLELKLSNRLDILHRLFLMVITDRIYNDEEELVIREIAKSMRIGSKRYELIRKNTLKEKGYQTKEEQEKEQKKQSWNFYMMDQLIKMSYNPFAVLGLEQNASNNQVKHAYRVLAKQYHPDKSMKEDEETRKQDALKILEINEAYEAIKKMRGIK